MIQTGSGKSAHATLDQPLEHLVACHGRIQDLVAALERAAELSADRPAEARETIAAVFRYFETSGVLHTRDEEESVFPRLLGHVAADEKEFLDSLEAQHREAEKLYQLLRQVPEAGENLDGYSPLVKRFCTLYREHIAAENDRLIAAGRRILSPEDLAAVSSEMRARRT
jgi:hemerythrin-like domain-containing protein